MNNNINIAELLKDCPKGTKLYSTIFGEVELKEVKDNGRSVCIFVTNFYGQEEMFYPDGKYNTHYSDSECTLFPSKEQRDWSKFCPFKNGDVLSDRGTVFIFNRRRFDKYIASYVYNSHCMLIPNNHLVVRQGFCHMHDKVSFASEEEKQKLFKAIKDNGYKWNEETKTLEKGTMRPMNDKERESLYHSYIATHGGRHQAMKAVEECAELTAALMHFFADRARLEDLITEIADVQIMCEQLALMFGQAEVEREKQRKLERMKERLTGHTHTGQ